MNDEKGFVIKDRRTFDEEGELRDKPQSTDEETAPETSAAGAPDTEAPEAEAPEAEQAPPPLPEINFNSLIFSLSSSALLHLGEIADPHSGEKRRDLALAKHAIDTIAMLKDKTTGNLDDEEASFLEGVLTDLRLRYVRATR